MTELDCMTALPTETDDLQANKVRKNLGDRSVKDSPVWRNSRIPCHFGRHLFGCVVVLYRYLQALAERNPQHFCFPRIATLVKKLGYSRARIFFVLRVLITIRAITTAERDGRRGWIVNGHDFWTHLDGETCCVIHRRELKLIGTARPNETPAGSKRDFLGGSNKTPDSLVGKHIGLEPKGFADAYPDPTLLQGFQSIFSEESNPESQRPNCIGKLTETPEKTEEQLLPTVGELLAAVVQSDDLGELLEAISFGRVELKNSAFVKFRGKENLLQSCRRVTGELGTVRFALRETCIRLMNRTMVLLRKDFDLDVPKFWVPILRQLRAEVAAETADEVSAFVKTYAPETDSTDKEPLSEAEISRGRSLISEREFQYLLRHPALFRSELMEIEAWRIRFGIKS
jgi:hypothetical protein